MIDNNPVNHRTLVGIQRRQKMRMRLIESALCLFAEKGIDTTIIDDVIVAAGVSRGTFYNYFRTTGELLSAVGEALSNDLLSLIESVVGDLPDPVERLATGLRMFLHAAWDCPDFARFIWRAGFNAASPGHLIYTYLPRHIEAGIGQGRINISDPLMALDVIAGISLVGVFSLSTRPVAADYPERMVSKTLITLGLTQHEADRLVALPLSPIVYSEGMLLARFNRRTQA